MRLAEGPLRPVLQITPTALPRLLGDPDREKANRVMNAMLQMKKIEIAELEHASD